MCPLFMDTEYNSPGSLSAEESHSNTPGSEREGDEQQRGQRGTKRKEKNRDAARKSRRKQTERADELHEELQCLERSNSALQKEVASLKRDFHFYTAALERHNPFCCLQGATPSSSSTPCLSVSHPVDCQAGANPPRGPPQASISTQAAVLSLSTSLTSSPDLQTPDCVKSTPLSSSTPALTTTTSASSSSSSYDFFTSSGSRTASYSTSWWAALAPQSVFSDDPPPLATSTATPVCTSSLTAAAIPRSRQGAIREHLVLADACSSALHPDPLDAFLTEPASFQMASSNVPPCAHLVAENTGLGGQSRPENAPQLHPAHFSGIPINSNVPHSPLLPVHQALSVSPQRHPEPSPASASKPSSSQHVSFDSESLLSLLTVPSPISVSLAAPSSLDGSIDQTMASPSPLGVTSKDLSLSELLEVNDWILQ